ncbi:hypothetical protein Hanom_Chr01g00075951 [Helianthus anomalus]
MVIFWRRYSLLLVPEGVHKVDISKITPPTSPPSRTFGLSPPRPDPRGKEKEDEVEQVENVAENVAGVGGDGGGGGGVDGRGEGVDTEADSSEATPCHTIYTKCLSGSGGGSTSGVRRSPEYEHVQRGSWDTQNPACADLPHSSRWNLTQVSQMTALNKCRELFSLAIPPVERLF